MPKPPLVRGPAVERTAEQGHPLAHAQQTVAGGLALAGAEQPRARVRRRSPRVPMPSGSQVTDTTAVAPGACLTTLVSASWTMR